MMAGLEQGNCGEAWNLSHPEKVIEIQRRYADAGQTILYVSHRLAEVIDTADDVTVLRDGRHVVTRPVAGLSRADLVDHMMDRSITVGSGTGRKGDGAEVVRLDGVTGGPLRHVELDVREGEVVGVGGLLGSGRTELLETMFGLRPAGGTMSMLGGEHRPAGPRDAMGRGIAYVPEDRAGQAAFLDMSVAENLSVTRLADFTRAGRIVHRAERRAGADALRTYQIACASERELLSSLSGGNQQKVILGRWLARRPRLLLLDEPTQGVDVGARAELHRLVRAAAAEGTAVIVVSSDFEELASLCDRVVILGGGAIVADLHGGELTERRIAELAYSTARFSA